MTNWKRFKCIKKCFSPYFLQYKLICNTFYYIFKKQKNLTFYFPAGLFCWLKNYVCFKCRKSSNAPVYFIVHCPKTKIKIIQYCLKILWFDSKDI